MTLFQNHTMRLRATAVAAGMAALSTLAIAPATAAPFSAAGMQRAPIESPVEQVGCRGCAVGAGVAAGVIAGAAIAGAASRNRYYRDNYYYNEPAPVYGRGYGYGPPRGYGRCWVETNPMRGTGYWGRC